MAIQKYSDYINEEKKKKETVLPIATKQNTGIQKYGDYVKTLQTDEDRIREKMEKLKKPSNNENAIDTAKYLGGKALSGGLSVPEGIADLGASVLKGVGWLTSKIVDNPVGEFIFGKDAGKIENNVFYQIGDQMVQDEIAGDLSKTVSDKYQNNSYVKDDSIWSSVAEGAGQVAGLIATGSFIGATELFPTGTKSKVFNTIAQELNSPTTQTMFLSTSGNGYTSALKDGASETDAVIYGLLEGAKETATEMMYGGLGSAFGKGALDDVVKDAITSKIKNEIGKKAVDLGISMTAEGIEEVAATLLEPFVKYVYNHDLNFTEYDSILQDFVGGALVSGVVQGGQITVDKLLNSTSKSTNKNIDETQIIETNTNLNNIQQEQKNDAEVSTKQEINTDNAVYTNEISNIANELDKLKSLRKETTEINEQKKLDDQIKELQNQLTTIQNQIEDSNTKNNISEQQTIENKVNLPGIDNNISKINLPGINNNNNNINVEPTTFEESAKYHNIDPNTDEYKFAKAIKDKLVVDVLFKDKVTNAKGEEVNGLYNPFTRTIELNMNSGQTIQHLLTHELSHALEDTDAYQSLQKLVMDYSAKSGGTLWQDAINDISNRYFSEYGKRADFNNKVQSEATAEILGNLINDQKFLNELATSNPNIFTKLYAKINELIAKVTGSEKAYLRAVKAKMELAWKQASEGKNKNEQNNEIKYSTHTTKDGLKYVESNNLKSEGELRQKDVFNILKGTEYTFEDGDKAFIIDYLKSNDKNIKDKRMYKELFNRYPTYFKNIEDIKDFNSLVNYNTDELLKASKKIQDRIKDINGKHKAWNIESFDTRESILYDRQNDKAYIIDFSVANLKDGKKIAYAKKMAQASDDILNKIKTDNWAKNTHKSVRNNNVSQKQQNVNNDTSIKYSIPLSKNNEQNVDNQGRELSKQQQEYFKDAKTRNNKGELIELYHGTPNDFTVFNTKNFGGANGTAEGFGIYLTDNMEVADDYLQQDKGKVMKLYANITKPATTDNLTVNKQDIIKAIKELTNKEAQQMVNDGDYDNINDAIKDTWISNYTYTYDKSIEDSYDDVAKTILESSENDYEILQELMNGSGNNDYKNANNYYTIITDTLGFDGIKTRWDFSTDSELKKKNADIWIAFYPNQVKNVDNTNPTANDDIRYSKDIYGKFEEFIEEKVKPINKIKKESTFNDIKLPIKEKTILPNTNNTQNNEKNILLPSARVQNEINEMEGLKAANDAFGLNEEETKRLETLSKKYDKDYVTKKKFESAEKKVLTQAIKEAKNNLGLTAKESKEFKEKLQKLTKNTKEELMNELAKKDVKKIISDYSERTITHEDSDIAEVKKRIRNQNLKVSDYLKNQITDYGDFKKRNFGKLKLSKDGIPVDTFYAELVEEHPGYFDRDVINDADILETLADFMDKDTSYEESIKLPDDEINEIADKVYNKILDNSLTLDEIDNIDKEIYERINKKTRKDVQEQLLEKMGITTDDLQVGKDITSLDFQRTDPIRVNEKVFGYKTGNKINDATIRQTKHNEAERTRFLNKERAEIKDLGIKAHSKESAAVQKYGEKQYVTDKGDIVPYGDAQLMAEFPDADTQNKIKNAAKEIRKKYDAYIDEINSVITEMGYDSIPKRQDYFRHFQEIGDKLSQWGIPLNADSMSKDTLPTDINGITDQFKPGKNWFASAMQRKGIKTTYDAITGIDGYLEGASNLIYHTEDIQRYRTLSKLVRDTYGQTHGLDNISLDTKEGQQRLNDIFDNKLSKYAAWLDEQANALAGKKGTIDRGVERALGRRIYNILDAAKKQVGSNMTGFNVRSALTNFASAVQGASKTNKQAWIKGTISTIQNMIRDDGLINKSDFLTSRFGSDQLSKKLWQKVSNAGQIFMTGTDYFTSNQIWRSKYYENLSKGMNETQAIKSADDFAARIMGDRSKGSTAEIFNSKTLGLLTQFQLEVNNQWSSIIHDNKMDIKSGNKSGAAVMFQLGQLAAMSYLFNNFMRALTGSDVMIDPIDLLKKIFGKDDDEDKTLEERAREAFGDLLDDVPFASIMNGGRIPISEAFKGGETLLKYATGQKDKYGNDIKLEDVKKDLIESGYYWILPTGYGQIKKTTKGLSMYDKNLPVAGSYTDSGNLRFKADDSTAGKVKAVLFGQYSSKEAQKYIESGYKTVSQSHIKEMQDLDMSSSEYVKYRNKLSSAGTTNNEKINYVVNSNYTDKQKNIMAKNILNESEDKYLTSSQITDNYYDYAKWSTDISELRKNTSNDKEETINYINELPLSIPQKALFIKTYYKSFKQYDSEIIKYIVNQDLTLDEKSAILLGLGYTIKDGKVYTK